MGSSKPEAKRSPQTKLKHGGIGNNFPGIIAISNGIHHGLQVSMELDLNHRMGPDLYTPTDIPGEFGNGIGSGFIIMKIGDTHPYTSAYIGNDRARGWKVFIKVDQNIVQGGFVISRIGLSHIVIKGSMGSHILVG
jgi:hypothetical protein